MVKGSQYLLIPAIGLCISWSLYLELYWPRSGLQCPWTSQNWLLTKVSVTKCHLQKKSLLMTHSWEVILTIQLFHHLLNFFKAFSTLENTVQYLEVLKKSKTQGKCLAQYKHSTNISVNDSPEQEKMIWEIPQIHQQNIYKLCSNKVEEVAV